MIMHHLWHRRYFALFEPIDYGHLLLSIGMMGKMSMNMWLIHLFFIVYGIHFRNPFVDLVWIYLVSLVAAFINIVCFSLKFRKWFMHTLPVRAKAL